MNKLLKPMVVMLALFYSGNVLSQNEMTCCNNQITLYHGQGVDSNLMELPEQIITADIPWEKSYFEGIGYTHYVPTPAWLQAGLGIVGINNPSTALEFIAVKHRGMQSNGELDLAYMLRSRKYGLGPVSTRLGAGVGLSYALGRPSYEDGPSVGSDRRFRFQSYEAFELELGFDTPRNLSLVGRVHHRSGMYGLIAPKHVGSNFLTLGVRMDL